MKLGMRSHEHINAKMVIIKVKARYVLANVSFYRIILQKLYFLCKNTYAIFFYGILRMFGGKNW